MTIRNVPYTECAACDKPIYAGTLAMHFCRSIEQLEYTKEYPAGVIEVADCSEIITLCVACGRSFSVKRATEVLKAAVTQPQFIRN
jgi:hypothetical protein